MSQVDMWTIVGFALVSVAGVVFSPRVRAILWAMIRHPFQPVTIVQREDGSYAIEREKASGGR